MENTSALMFDKEHEKYFLAIEGKALGPMTAQAVYERIQQGEVNLLHYIWMEGASDWKRICDQKDFAVLIPQKPSSQSIQSIKDKLAKKRAAKTPPTPDSEPKQIYLYYGSTQYGPFSKPEVEHVLRTHHLSRSAYLWIPGWANWKRLADQPEYAEFFNEAPPAPPSSKKSPRTEKSAPSLEISSSGLKKKNK